MISRKHLIAYGPIILFIIIRMPWYINTNGIIWADVIICGIIGGVSGYLAEYIEKKDNKKNDG